MTHTYTYSVLLFSYDICSETEMYKRIKAILRRTVHIEDYVTVFTPREFRVLLVEQLRKQNTDIIPVFFSFYSFPLSVFIANLPFSLFFSFSFSFLVFPTSLINCTLNWPLSWRTKQQDTEFYLFLGF